MLVWGGQDDLAITRNDGAGYDPVANAWTAISPTGVPAGRVFHTAVWAGSRMIVWGGAYYDGLVGFDLNTGGLYDPTADAWTATSTTGAPAARDRQTAVWTGALMLAWGGQDDSVTQLNDGARYDPLLDAWTPMATSGSPIGRRYHTAVWTGSLMIPWGGWNLVDLNSGGRYCVSSCTSPAPTGSPTLSLTADPGGTTVSWAAIPVATAYDLVRGPLSGLRSSGGNFTTSTNACLADDVAGTTFLDSALPVAADGFWYLVRGVTCVGGPYDSSDPSQVGSRDAEINAAPSACP